ncbi:hypothetical protein C8R43DRAFT_344123 [Mycena crocata]|nr:hypothetical protein C8R43DRAFT_344123 [Mycena crocata]
MSPQRNLCISAFDGYGYMDVIIGTVISGFEVVRKLGWDRSSSVWLCRDTFQASNTYVALKVITRIGSAVLEAKLFPEYEVLSTVRSANPAILVFYIVSGS